MPSSAARAESLGDLLRFLVEAHIDFILVGGLASVAQGAPIVTLDMDIVPLRTPENLQRLATRLAEIDARYRLLDERIIRPSADRLDTPGHNLLMTRLGPLDVLGTIDAGRDYASLLPLSIGLVIGGREVRVLSLRAIVEAKRASSHAKDKAVLPVLEATLRELDGQ